MHFQGIESPEPLAPPLYRQRANRRAQQPPSKVVASAPIHRGTVSDFYVDRTRGLVMAIPRRRVRDELSMTPQEMHTFFHDMAIFASTFESPMRMRKTLANRDMRWPWACGMHVKLHANSSQGFAEVLRRADLYDALAATQLAVRREANATRPLAVLSAAT